MDSMRQNKISFSRIRALKWIADDEGPVVVASCTNDGAGGGELEVIRPIVENGEPPYCKTISSKLIESEGCCIDSTNSATTAVVGCENGTVLTMCSENGKLNITSNHKINSHGCTSAAVTSIKSLSNKICVGTEAGYFGLLDINNSSTTLSVQPATCQLPILAMEQMTENVLAMITMKSLYLWDIRQSTVCLGPISFSDQPEELTTLNYRMGSSEIIVGKKTPRGGAFSILDLRNSSSDSIDGVWAASVCGSASFPPPQLGQQAFSEQSSRFNYPVATHLVDSKTLLSASFNGQLYESLIVSELPGVPNIYQSSRSEPLMQRSDIPAPLTSLDVAGPAVAVGTRGRGVVLCDLLTR